jgi:hypothetical protein
MTMKITRGFLNPGAFWLENPPQHGGRGFLLMFSAASESRRKHGLNIGLFCGLATMKFSST